MRRREEKEKNSEPNEKKRREKHQVHFVGFHSAKRTHTHTHRSSSKKILAAEHRVVRREEKHNDTRAD
jgi:hypothetical protein